MGQSSIPTPKIAAVKQKGVWHILIDSGPNNDIVIINKNTKYARIKRSYVFCNVRLSLKLGLIYI